MTQTRRGFTLFELLVVMAVIIVLGVVLVPTLTGLSRDSKSQAAKDTISSKLHEARSFAIEEVRAYRVWVSADGTKMKIAPEEMEGTQAVIEPSLPAHVMETPFPDGITVTADGTSGQAATPDSTGWIPMVTFKTDGSCRENRAYFVINEPGVSPTNVEVRGMTGGVSFANLSR